MMTRLKSSVETREKHIMTKIYLPDPDSYPFAMRLDRITQALCSAMELENKTSMPAEIPSEMPAGFSLSE